MTVEELISELQQAVEKGLISGQAKVLVTHSGSSHEFDLDAVTEVDSVAGEFVCMLWVSG